jgi:hypothetical protein
VLGHRGRKEGYGLSTVQPKQTGREMLDPRASGRGVESGVVRDRYTSEAVDDFAEMVEVQEHNVVHRDVGRNLEPLDQLSDAAAINVIRGGNLREVPRNGEQRELAVRWVGAKE